jgi:hypothetical protein
MIAADCVDKGAWPEVLPALQVSPVVMFVVAVLPVVAECGCCL